MPLTHALRAGLLAALVLCAAARAEPPASGPQAAPDAAAARLADQYVLGLRSADALHLAIASDHGATLSTLDQRLATAAGALGLAAELV